MFACKETKDTPKTSSDNVSVEDVELEGIPLANLTNKANVMYNGEELYTGKTYSFYELRA
ncbi:MAG: hypothetical protein H6554_08900 [Chitinophagales bacterium]|nr:hypothetical protein [Chitinophagales bacterium]